MMLLVFWNRIIYQIRDYLYSRELRQKRDTDKYPLVNRETIDSLKPIYKSAYPESIHGYDEVVHSCKDLIRYLDCHDISQVYYILEKGWYVLLVDRTDCIQIAEFAAMNGRCRDFFRVITYLKRNFSDRVIEAVVRDSTSYPLLMKLEQRGTIRIVENDVVIADGEPYHALRFVDAKREYVH